MGKRFARAAALERKGPTYPLPLWGICCTFIRAWCTIIASWSTIITQQSAFFLNKKLLPVFVGICWTLMHLITATGEEAELDCPASSYSNMTPLCLRFTAQQRHSSLSTIEFVSRDVKSQILICKVAIMNFSSCDPTQGATVLI